VTAVSSPPASSTVFAAPRGYSSVRVAGSLLTAALIGRIGSGDPQLPGLRSEDYGLAPGRRLGEFASRHWEELLGVYREFQQQLTQASSGESRAALTRERWLLPLFDALGFGRLHPQREGLTVAGRTFPVSHLGRNVPIHLVAWGRDLDRRSNGERAPQSMLQDFLNSSDEHVWGMLSNGQKLRLLRDAASLSEAAFIEFDLESMFDGALYADFVLLFALAHSSRFEARTSDKPGNSAEQPSVANCWIERWRVEGDRAGIRFRAKLRDGLKAALEELGTGFLEGNAELREKLRRGDVSRREFRDELLRLAYQLLFLFVAEDKGALLAPDADQAAQDRYRTYFSTQRLRRIAVQRVGDRHDDLWRTLLIVLNALGSDEGCPELALPALGGLFVPANAVEGDGSHPGLLRGRDVTLSNRRLLAAVRHLTRVEDEGGCWQQVDYQHLDAEELGLVYESLLNLVPYTDPAVRVFELRSAAGNDRKTTGSYYTPSSLVETLLDSTLDPVIEEHAKRGVPDDLLKITVCDPACGSGHFLVAAARRIARAYAVLEAGDEEPTPDAISRAMPKVVRHCIYGVDLNPLAVELTKVSLWLASVEPGKPLAFLDDHIKVGNALFGATPRLLEAGIPDGAFTALKGDDRKVAAGLRARNRREVRALHRERGREVRGQAQEVRVFDAPLDKQRCKRAADAWCAAFVWPQRPGAPDGVTTATLLRISQGQALPPDQQEMIDRLARKYRFFHWHVEFPEVFRGCDGDPAEDFNPVTGWRGGFTCVLGNPPWERVKLQEREFFESRHSEVAGAANKAQRKALISELAGSEEGAHLLREFQEAKHTSEGLSLFLRESGKYPLNGRGDVNTYSVFTEQGKDLLHPHGRLGVIVPTGIITDATTQHFFKDVVGRQVLASVFDFENRRRLFPDVDSRLKFSLVTLTGHADTVEHARFAFFLHSAAELNEPDKVFTLSTKEILKLNPNTGTCPVFRSRRDAEITLQIYDRAPVLVTHGEEAENPWGVSFTRMFDMSNDAQLFRSYAELASDGWRLEGNIFVRGEEQMLPLYEAKMLHHYDHRWATYGKTGRSARDIPLEEKNTPHGFALPRYWVPRQEVEKRVGRENGWLIGFRKISNVTNERTLVSFAFPLRALADSGNILLTDKEEKSSLYANITSFILDYTLRQKLGGTNLNFFQFEQLPVISPEDFSRKAAWDFGFTVHEWLTPRVLELSYTTWDMELFARDLGDFGAPFVWDEERRFLLRCEIDAAFFHLYGIARDDVSYIMEMFPLVKRKDLKQHGFYRTKDTILEVYDAMAKAIEADDPYQTVLDPPPGKGSRHCT